MSVLYNDILIDTSSSSLDLQSKIEELNTQLKEANLTYKEKEYRLVEKCESYESQIQKLQDECKQTREKYDKLFEAHRKLQKTNDTLEDKLLGIVQKYEMECDQLKSDLEITHSRLIEAKLLINDLEDEKRRYKQDCNLAVNLLQCRPNDFMSHTFNTLPINLKDRLTSHLTQEEIHKLECAADNERETNKKLQQTNSTFKIPVMQPTAAAAIMYNMQNITLKQQQQQQQQQQQRNVTLKDTDSHTTLNMDDANAPLIKSIEKKTDSGRVPSTLIAEILRKDSDSEKKRLFPYVCTKCKKDIWTHDSPTQTVNDPNKIETDYLRILQASSEFNSKNSNKLSHNRSKSYANNMDTVIVDQNDDKTTIRNSNSKTSRTHLDSWTDLDINSINYK